MPIFQDNYTNPSTTGEHMRLIRKPRSQFPQPPPPLPLPIAIETDPNQPDTCRPIKATTTISSLFLHKKKSNNGRSRSFRGMGCTVGAARQVSVPEAIRSSAEWEGGKKKRVKKKKKVGPTGTNDNNNNNNGNNSNNKESGVGNCMVMQEVWCGPGMGFYAAADAVVGPVEKDCVVSRRNIGSSSASYIGRGKIDAGEKFNPRERERERERQRAYCSARRAAVNPDILSFWDTDSTFETFCPDPEAEVFRSRYRRQVRHPSPDGLDEMMMLQSSFIMGGRLDRFSDWRLDIDNMTYEQLLELGDRIGYVNTGLQEEDIARCIRKMKPSVSNDLPIAILLIKEKKCTICQEEFEADDELGKLDCGHGFHTQCIKQWLGQKNCCPVCKTAPLARG